MECFGQPRFCPEFDLKLYFCHPAPTGWGHVPGRGAWPPVCVVGGEDRVGGSPHRSSVGGVFEGRKT